MTCSDSFVYGALALSLAIIRINFDGLKGFISLDCNVVYLVLLGYYLFAVINQRNKIVKTVKIGPNDGLR